jgi:hypothetical protein
MKLTLEQQVDLAKSVWEHAELAGTEEQRIAAWREYCKLYDRLIIQRRRDNAPPPDGETKRGMYK